MPVRRRPRCRWLWLACSLRSSCSWKPGDTVSSICGAFARACSRTISSRRCFSLERLSRISSGEQSLRDDYLNPTLHVGLFNARGRRLRRNYGWIFLIQIAAYTGKLLIHPTTVTSVEEVWARAVIGPIPGEVVLVAGALFHGAWITIALTTWKSRRGTTRGWADRDRKDPMLDLSRQG